MKNKIATIFIILILAYAVSSAQTPGVKWTDYYPTLYGDNVSEILYDLKATPDGGFLLAGGDTSFGYNKDRFLKKSFGGRPRLIKTDRDGNVIWRAMPADVDNSQCAFTSVQLVSSGGSIAAGYGNSKCYIARYNNNGTKLWYKIYGGLTGLSKAYSIKQTADSGYIVAGYTTANDGNVTGNHNPGTGDIWLFKLDSSGNLKWQKCFGGSGEDTAYDVIQTPDRGFVIAGASASPDGDLTGNSGLSDAWIFKTDSLGNLLWQKNIGGSSDEDLKSIILNSDTSFTLTGSTLSSSVTSNGNHGKKDLWVIKIKDATGQIVWSKSFGGSEDEQGYSIQRTVGNGYLIGGYTESADGDVTMNHGGADAWLLKLTSDGNLIWQTSPGTVKDDFGLTAIAISENDFAIAGYAQTPVPQQSNDFTVGLLARLGNINTIKGLLFNDINLNGVKDPLEQGFNEALVTSAKPGHSRSALPQKGLFNVAVDTGAYSTSVQINNPYYNVVPANINSSFTTYFNTDSISFAIQPMPGKKDLTINVVALTPARQGLPDTYIIYYKNTGTTVVGAGEILFKKDSRLDIVSTIPAVSSSNGDTLKWSYSNLQPLDTASILLNLQVQIPPVVNIGDTVTSVAFITPVSADETPLDDTDYVKQIVIGARDPNNKSENNAGQVTPKYITDGKYLDYTILFQNTGTDTALNVIVKDTLDSKLDWSTLQMTGASDPYNLTIEDGNKLSWTFNNIKLPDSTINEPASHGYIAYRIKPKSNVVAGNIINNTASIYFDFNLPVITNNAFTIVQNNVVLPLSLLNFSGVYNNQRVVLHWSTVNEYDYESFEVERSPDGINYKPIGLKSSNGNGTVANYDFPDDLANVTGNVFYYRLRMISRDNKIIYSQVILIRKTSTSVSAITITPNPAGNGQAFLTINSTAGRIIQFKIFDNNGKAVLRQQNHIFAGANSIILNNLNRLPAGVYIIQTINGPERFSTKFEIAR